MVFHWLVEEDILLRFAYVPYPFCHLQIFGIGCFEEGVVEFILEIERYALHSPTDVGEGVELVDAHMSCHITVIPYVGMPGQRVVLGVCLMAFYEVKMRWGIHLRIVIGYVDCHEELIGKNGCAVFFVDAADAAYVVAYEIAIRNAIGILPRNGDVNVIPTIIQSLELLVFILSSSLPACHVDYPGNGSAMRKSVSSFSTL